MKKSEIYRLAMDAVLTSNYRNEVKLRILKVLFEDESLALYKENKKEGEEC